MILLVGGEKGGTGKTTLATNLAVMRIQSKRDVLLVDTDQQRTASYWCLSRDEHNVEPRVASVQKFDKSVRSEILALKNKYDDIIIDAGGRDSQELRAGLLVADTVLTPLRPSQFDLWTLVRINNLISEIKQVNENLRALVCLNQASTNPSVKETEESKGFFSEFQHISLAESVISERIVFRKSAMYGKSVPELAMDNKATNELNALYKEIFNGY
jgi:chromosome partitioning protein